MLPQSRRFQQRCIPVCFDGFLAFAWPIPISKQANSTKSTRVNCYAALVNRNCAGEQSLRRRSTRIADIATNQQSQIQSFLALNDLFITGKCQLNTYCLTTMEQPKRRLIINSVSQLLMEGGIYQRKLSKKNQALQDLVRPDDDTGDWEYNFTDVSDFDRIFHKITSVPDWKQDMELVYLFVVMRRRKHKFFSQSCFKEDLVIVPNLWHIAQQRPNTEGLSEQQRKLFLLVHDFICSVYSKYLKAGYDQVYQQFDEIENWKANPALAKLHKGVKALEAWNREKIMPRAPQIEQEQNEQIRIEAEKWVSQNKQRIERYIYGKNSATEQYLKMLLCDIRHCRNWRHNETLWKWNGLLASQLRILQFKKQGAWQSRIDHIESQSQKGLIQKIWGNIWAEKEGGNEKRL